MRLLSAALALGVACAASAEAAGGETRFQIRAVVSTECVIDSAQMLGGESLTHIVVRTTCNAQNFRMAVHSGLGHLNLTSASSNDANLNRLGNNELAVRLNRPGQQVFTLQLAEPLDPGTPLNIQLTPV